MHEGAVFGKDPRREQIVGKHGVHRQVEGVTCFTDAKTFILPSGFAPDMAEDPRFSCL